MRRLHTPTWAPSAGPCASGASSTGLRLRREPPRVRTRSSGAPSLAARGASRDADARPVRGGIGAAAYPEQEAVCFPKSLQIAGLRGSLNPES